MASEDSEERGSLVKTDSMESRWVYQDDDISDIDDDDDDEGSPSRFAENSEDDDNVEQRLIRTGPRVDSFDVEALDVPGAGHRHEFEEFGPWRNVVLVLQTLGVVFGDVGTSQLYTFSVMFDKAPINGKEDVLGALSLVLYTLILIPLIKYVLIVLLANDDGEGGTFALYSLICRHAKVSLIANQLPSDARISSFRLKVPSPELERSLKLKERLETSGGLKKILLMLVLAGTAMVIADGVVTPAMSVVSAVEGLKVGISGIKQGEVVMVAVTLLVILFSVQRYGTSKMGFIVGPALFIWFCCLAWIGIYNLVKYDRDVWKAFNPMHIYYYFERNKVQAWYSLGGCLLCATGAEAMFADLCYFSVRSVQLTFVFLVFPCLILGYLGQAAYLMQNQGDCAQAFYSSIPSGAFWPVFVIANVAALIASRAMTTATFSCIKQSTSLGCFPRLKIVHTSRKFMGQIYIPVLNWFLLAACVVLVCAVPSITEIGNAYGIAEMGVMMMTTILVTVVMLLIWQINIVMVIVFLIVFMGIESTFFSSVLWCVSDGSWIILVFAVVMFFVMVVWNYGSKLKYETEVKQKMSMDLLRQLGPSLGTIRAPGIGLVYNELVRGVPAIFGHFLTTLPAIHSMIIFVCIKYVPVPSVPQNERFLFRRVCSKGYHMFRCIARYGYKDVRKETHQTFEQLLIESLEKFIRREAQELSLESDGDGDGDTEDEARSLVAPNGSVYSLGVPLLTDFNDTSRIISEPSSSREARSETESESSDAEQSLERELSFIRRAKESGVVYLLGHGDIRARKDSWFLKKLVVNYFYAFLRKNSRRGISNLSVPHSHLMQVGMTYMV
ncbi:potassium transporter 7-like isoform X1 [Silene latifolia]|uniref:potassium transporter 7-like isoform X1 n=1 Tax=Silene latifolia TaxID=37657 RepID=UPI003D788899